jgi:phospholipase C
MLKYFRAFRKPGSELYERGITPLMHDFHSDVASGQLPAVSWLIPQMRSSEHPSYPPASGANGIMSVLNALTSNPAVWERTALIVSYDENGGFFDHVRPPTPAQGTAGEFVHGQPIGLGFRVPAMVISPYSRGGNVFSDILDHTSQLRLIGARFDVPVPNLTPWRAAAVGDLTGAFLGHPVASALPSARRASSAAHEAVTGDARVIAAARVGRAPRYPVPANSMPRQARAPARRFIG